jgi:Spy/CpxP family protein refolding chaperone
MHVKGNRFVKRWAVGTGFVLLCAAPGLAGAQSPPPAPPQTPRMMATPPPRPNKIPGPLDDFADLKLTADQKAKIHQIDEDGKSRVAAVVKEDRLSPEQKGAMIQGIQHKERGEAYKLLTPDQRTEVRKRILARREAAQKEQEKKKQSLFGQ